MRIEKIIVYEDAGGFLADLADWLDAELPHVEYHLASPHLTHFSLADWIEIFFTPAQTAERTLLKLRWSI